MLTPAGSEDDDRIDTTLRQQIAQERLPQHHRLRETDNVSRPVEEIVATIEIDFGDLATFCDKQVAQP
ncbi:hypothetical protein D3C81_779820 [compost metagenome]